jgi:hypothetical protein
MLVGQSMVINSCMLASRIQCANAEPIDYLRRLCVPNHSQWIAESIGSRLAHWGENGHRMCQPTANELVYVKVSIT